MTNLIAGVADLLMPDPAARIAIDETIKDYRDERAQTSSSLARLWIDVQGISALGRVLTLSAMRDLAASDTWRVVGSCFLLSAAAGLLIPLLLSGFDYPLPSLLPYLVLQFAALVFGPVAALGWFERADRPVRIIGPLVASALLMLVMEGWLIPVASQYFREAMLFKLLAGREGAGNLVRGPNELDLLSLIRRTRVDTANLVFVQALTLRTVVILTAPTGLLLGAAIRRRWRNRGNWRVLQASGLFAAIAIIVSVTIAKEMSFHRGSPNALLAGLVWLPFLIAWTSTILLVRRRPARSC